ncbi:hypothetical protein F1643_00195 [Azospirillum sp. INR13]|uniref:hypothetical protein n=1 Tax=Azospirillum sp. INR13 TaxID=2596919 RepID=UPI0018920BD4|nr:hypothetical protein [Azospirillum sp. INR13]MBF5093108.1 hypothetical protein [Azospirillum sp. INR13]
MVKGLDRFASHFKGYENQFVLIGGTALVVAMEEAGIDARATKDLDIVLCLEVLDPGFVNHFWAFIKQGGYERQERGEGKRVFYRFQKPTDPSFPEMLELFSRKPDALTLAEGQHLTPIPAGEEAESLSAILLDDTYYAFLHERKHMIGDLPLVDPLGLIALKAYAWKQLSAQKASGGGGDSKNITKHRNDIFRLFAMVDPDARIAAPPQIKDDIAQFLSGQDPALDLKPYGLVGTRAGEMIQALKAIYGLDGG